MAEITQKQQEVLDAASKYIVANDISQNEFCRRAGIGMATFSQVKSGSYNGDVAAVAEKIKEFLGRAKKEDTDKYAPVKSMRRVHEVCRRTEQLDCIAVITGRPGYGKTWAAKSFCEGGDGVYVYMHGAMTKAEMLKTIADELGQHPPRLGIADMLSLCIAGQKSWKRPLLIDEADRLTIPCLDLLRDLHEMAPHPLVLFGEPKLRDILQTGRSKGQDLARLYRRVRFQRELDPPDESDVELILERRGVNAYKDEIVPSIVEKIDGHGGFGTLSYLIEIAVEVAEKNDVKKIDDAVINVAWKELLNPSSKRSGKRAMKEAA